MKKHNLCLSGILDRRPRDHDGQVAAIRSNCRWCSDALEFTCWNGEVVRLAFALDCPWREAIAWVATTAGVSGEMIHDMMVPCVEQRFGGVPAPHPVQWLSDNGSIFATHRTIEIALALGLAPCFAPVESSESNGMAEASVKTLKRVILIPNAAVALTLIETWMGDYNTVHPHARLPVTSRVHSFPIRPVSGLTGSTPPRRNPSAGAAVHQGPGRVGSDNARSNVTMAPLWANQLGPNLGPNPMRPHGTV
jgi:putative transposase